MTDPRDLTRPPKPKRHNPRRSAPSEAPDPAAPDTDQAALATATADTDPPATERSQSASAAHAAGAAADSQPSQPAPADDPGATTFAGDEIERAFVQILVPPELAVRISRASHHLKLNVYKARFQQTIMGALIERHIPDPDEPTVVRAMAVLIARWRQEPLSERRASRRLGWHLPLELSARLDELLLNLKEQHYRLRPSATALLAALIWFELDPDTAPGQSALAQLVVPYYERWEQPAYEMLAA